MANVLSDVSNEIVATVENAGSGVVRVEARRRHPASGIVWSADGIIVTANHVVERDEGIKVGRSEGESFDAALLGRDPTTDLAVLKVEGAGLEASVFVGPDDIRVGNLVLALGRPGRTVQATLGLVSALGKSWRTAAGGSMDRYLQTDLVMYPGFSGGPLVTASGDVAGLNTSALSRGFNVAVPVPTLTRVVDSILTHGRVRRGFLGVGAQPARLPEDVVSSLGRETGLLVVSVEKGSPANTGGILTGDTLVAINGGAVRHIDDLFGSLSSDSVGKKADVQIVRGGKTQNVSVTIGERE